MTGVMNFVSPKSAFGSMFYSVAVHALLVAGVMLALHINFAPAPPAEEYIDLGYETFDAPPEVAPPKVVETKSEELQDEKSEVAGTQEKKIETNNGTQVQNTPQPTTPYYKIKPKYPKAALVSGTEGWVMLAVDINEKGEVENVRVVDGEQRNMFAPEAKRAVEQYKYRPFVDAAGKPVRKENHQVLVTFKLTDSEEAGS